MQQFRLGHGGRHIGHDNTTITPVGILVAGGDETRDKEWIGEGRRGQGAEGRGAQGTSVEGARGGGDEE